METRASPTTVTGSPSAKAQPTAAQKMVQLPGGTTSYSAGTVPRIRGSTAELNSQRRQVPPL